MRQTLCVIAAALVLSGCGGSKANPSSGAAARPFKIGIMTGTVSQGEEDFRAGEQVERKYPGRVKHVTYPDNFSSELETVVAQLTGLAADPEVKVIIVGQAIPGSVTAPAPTGEGGLPAAQQFILEDVPRQLKRLGPATAFYTTNDGMQEPMIKAILISKAGYFVEQDVPAPTAGFPAALGLRIPAA